MNLYVVDLDKLTFLATVVMLAFATVGSIILRYEDKNRRNGSIRKPVFAKKWLKVWAVGVTAFIAAFFVFGGGMMFLANWLKNNTDMPAMNAEAMATYGSAAFLAFYGIFTYLAIEPDKKELRGEEIREMRRHRPR